MVKQRAKRKVKKKAVKKRPKKKTVKRTPVKRKAVKKKTVKRKKKAVKKKKVAKKKKKAVKKKRATKKKPTKKKKAVKAETDEFEDIPEDETAVSEDIPAEESSIVEVPQKKKGFLGRLFRKKKAVPEPGLEEAEDVEEVEERPVMRQKVVDKDTKRQPVKKTPAKKKRAVKKVITEPEEEDLPTDILHDGDTVTTQGITQAKVIQTGVDKLVSLIKERRRVSIKEATKELGLAKDVVEEWGDFLESEGIIYLQHGLMATYLVDKAYSREEQEALKSEVSKQREIISRKLEGAITGLQRDAEEIRLVKNEFEDLHIYVKQNFERLHEEFNALAEFHDAYDVIRDQKRGIEKKYKSRLSTVSGNLAHDRDEYQALLGMLNKKLQRVKKEKRSLADIRGRELLIQRQVDELDTVMHILRDNIGKEIDRINASEKELTKNETRMARLKTNLMKEGEEIKDIFNELGKARLELEAAEKTFMEKVQKISKIKIPKKDVVAKGAAIVKKIQNFLAAASDIRHALKQLDLDRTQLEKAYRRLIRKTVAITASARKQGVPLFQWEELDKERETTDKLRLNLTTDLLNLRKRVRKLVK